MVHLKVLLTAVAFGSLIAAYGVAGEDDDRAMRMLQLTKTMEELTIKIGNDRKEQLTLGKAPVLRYSDAIASDLFIEIPDGVMFIWTRHDRPAAITTMHIGSAGMFWTEFLSLTSEPLFAMRKNETLWTPTNSGIEFKPIPNAPMPETTAAERMSQMRSLLNAVSASVSDARSGRQELRLLSKPVFRYSQPNAGITDGAIFVFARATNPEMLLVLEAHVDKNNQGRWMYSPARFTGRAGEMRCPDESLWSHDARHGNRDPAEPFFQMRLMPDPINVKR